LFLPLSVCPSYTVSRKPSWPTTEKHTQSHLK
jgi:hypothetical protein